MQEFIHLQAQAASSWLITILILIFCRLNLLRSPPDLKKVEGPIYLWGGLGYGEISNRFRIGGLGFGGIKETFGTVPSADNSDDYIAQDVEISFGGGGVYFEYLAASFDRFEAGFSLVLGGASLDIKISQYESSLTWDDLFDGLDPDNNVENFFIRTQNGGFLIQPGVQAKFFATRYFAMEVRASYLILLFLDDWRFGEVKLRNTPDVNLNAPVIGLSFIFGG